MRGGRAGSGGRVRCVPCRLACIVSACMHAGSCRHHHAYQLGCGPSACHRRCMVSSCRSCPARDAIAPACDFATRGTLRFGEGGWWGLGVSLVAAAQRGPQQSQQLAMPSCQTCVAPTACPGRDCSCCDGRQRAPAAASPCRPQQQQQRALRCRTPYAPAAGVDATKGVTTSTKHKTAVVRAPIERWCSNRKRWNAAAAR